MGTAIEKMCLQDGRTLAWAEYGDPNGLPVLYFHGGSGCMLEAACFAREARENGLRLIAASRPSAWQSSPKPNMKPLDYAADCLELTEHLGIERFVTTGNSNGGLFTMAVAFALPERVIGAVPINATSPFYDPAVRRMAPASLKLAMLTMKYMTWLLMPWIRSSLGSDRPAATLPADTEPEVVQLLVDNMLRNQRESIALECAIASRHWGFDHRAVRCPVRIIYGESDTSRYLGDTWARELRDGQHITVPGGHIPISPATRRILATTWRSLFIDQSGERPA
jgi:pimeloyl-ACP methyl ester carboxylesterase